MKPNEMVLSLDIAKRLHEKGIVVESCFQHVAVYQNHKQEEPSHFEVHAPVGNRRAGYTYKTLCPAPLPVELLEVLPDEYAVMRSGQVYTCFEYENRECEDTSQDTIADTPADALALMALWLHDNGHLENPTTKIGSN